MAKTLMWVGLSLMVLSALCGWFPLWKSETLSPESIKRRVFWSGMAVSLVLFFLALLPDLRASMIGTVGMALGILAIAFRWTGHIKIRGRIYTADPSLRRPDSPPALTRNGLD